MSLLSWFVNPEILEYSEDMETGMEACLSVPGMCGDVLRHKRIKVKYFNGIEEIVEEYEGMNARIIQHEYDHLIGVLYIDKAENMREFVAEQKE